MENIIEIKNLSKRYNITHMQGGYITLRDVLMNIFKHPFKFAKHKTKNVLGISGKEEFWALRDISLTVKPGEVIGVIGKNGAGKSTLLKILTGITPPTKGEAILRGKVSSLLEVGTGFHPELTGRENIFLNGAILGMPRKEIARKFDEIVAFAGVEKFLDTPVKRYSSGMYVRLAFSVAAHMEPDILIIDEVLAVGDAEFQKKCLGKMEEVTRKQGRTILFVSHNMSAVRQLCTKTLLLEKGKVAHYGPTEEVIAHYLHTAEQEPVTEYPENPERKMQIRKVSILNKDGIPSTRIIVGEPFSLKVMYDVRTAIPGTELNILCTNQENIPIFFENDLEANADLQRRSEGTHVSTFTFTPHKTLALNSGVYFFRIRLEIPGADTFTEASGIQLEIIHPTKATRTDHAAGVLAITPEWKEE